MKSKIFFLIVLLIILVIALTYRKSLEVSPSINTDETKVTRSDLTLADIKNTTIPAAWSDGEFVKLIDGEYKPTDSISAVLLDATSTYAVTDFNSDGAGDIFVTTVSNSGGTGWFYNLIAFKNVGGEAVYAGSMDLGDRIKINKISADKNEVTADIITQGPGEGLCCGTLRQVKTYTFNGAVFKEE